MRKIVKRALRMLGQFLAEITDNPEHPAVVQKEVQEIKRQYGGEMLPPGGGMPGWCYVCYRHTRWRGSSAFSARHLCCTNPHLDCGNCEPGMCCVGKAIPMKVG
jgi:hypothetical protein